MKTFKQLDKNMRRYRTLKKLVKTKEKNIIVEDDNPNGELLALVSVVAKPSISIREIEAQVNVSRSVASRI